MGMLFNIDSRNTKEQDIALAKKSKSNVKNATVVKSGILAIIENAKSVVEEKLGHLKNEYIIIRDKDSLKQYLRKCNDNKVISIDTETTGLDPIIDKIVGLCLYTPGEKACYVPINHVSYMSNERISNQLTEQDIKECFDECYKDSTDVIMFNAKFDIRVLRNQCNIFLKCKWDCYLAARCLNENEGERNNGLKQLHKKYVLENKEDAFSFGELFKGVTFDKVPIDTAYIYAAHDAIITYELYEFQKQYLYYEEDKPLDARNGMNGVSWVFENIEMPVVDVVCNMEDNGIDFDTNYANELSIKYNDILKQKEDLCYAEISKYDELINDYKKSHQGAKIDSKINLSSPSQIAILLYDILKIEPVDTKNLRGTGEDILKKINIPITNTLLDYREFSKLVSTYVDKLPNCVNPKDHRIHCNFNQYGADTGRFSSKDPNLQNIPSHNKDIRKMFKASDGYVLMSSDFSQQEPKCLAALCRQQGDSQMYDTFMEGKDLYSEIASKAFHVPYEDCKEFRPDGTTNKDGKARRTSAKSILLGVLYGRGTASVAEQLKCSIEEAENIKQSVFKGFPAIKKFEDDSLRMAKELGYVTTVCGRKRRLFDLQLPEYEFEWHGDSNDPLDFNSTNDEEVPEYLAIKYWNKLHSCRFNKKMDIFKEANKEGVWIIDNTKKIADATRQCVNARIQGSAADLTKIAMIELNKNERLKELGFRMLIPIHDEILAECPEVNMRECSKLLAETMSKAAEKILQMPIKCDVAISKCWYGDEIMLD